MSKKCFKRKFRFVLHKAYFDKGYNLTSYLKYVIALFGISSLDVVLTLVIGFFYGIGCYFLGRWWIKKHFFEAEIEVSNMFNRFVRETRSFIKKKKFK